ncbi:MAG: TIGR04372 family glycosyltransferase [Actinomycetota bacterium]
MSILTNLSSRAGLRFLRGRRAVSRWTLLPITIPLATLLALFSTRRRILIMPMNTSRVGHLGIDVEYALSELDTLPARVRPRLLIVPMRIDLKVANRALVRAWKDSVCWIPQWLGVPLIWLLRSNDRTRSLVYRAPKNIAGRFHWGGDPYGFTATGAAHLRIAPEQMQIACRSLEQMGLDLSRPYVCLHIRDSRYHQVHSGSQWREPQEWRNLDLGLFSLAVQSLAEEGYQVVRLGVNAKERLLGADEREVFDYATNGFRSELMDVVLVSRCAFMVSTNSGIDSLAQTFRKPLYNVGVIAPSQLYIHRNLFSIIQRFREISTGRLLSLRESLVLPRITDASLAEMGLSAVPNSADEIADLAIEADQRFRGVWGPTDDDLNLQRRFQALLPSEFRRFPIRGGIGTAFLRRHRDWLD